MDDLDKQVESVNQSVAMSRLVADMAKKQDTENRRLWAALCAALVTLALTACCMAYMVHNVQEIANAALLNALDTVAEMEVTGDTTTTVTQDTGEGGGNAIYQAGENATYTEGGEG